MSRVSFVIDASSSKWENPRHRRTALREARSAGKMIRENPEAYPVTIGADDGGRTPEFVRAEFDWARKHG